MTTNVQNRLKMTEKKCVVIFLKFRQTARNPQNAQILHKFRTVEEYCGNSVFYIHFCKCGTTGIYDCIVPPIPTTIDYRTYTKYLIFSKISGGASLAFPYAYDIVSDFFSFPP